MTQIATRTITLEYDERGTGQPAAPRRAELDAWPEMGERTRQWFSLAEAAGLVDEADLKRLLSAFAPKAGGASKDGGR